MVKNVANGSPYIVQARRGHRGLEAESLRDVRWHVHRLGQSLLPRTHPLTPFMLPSPLLLTSPQIVACNGALCGPKVALRVTPSGSVHATMPTLPAGTTVPAAPAAAPGAVVGTMPTPSGYGAMLPGSQWRVVMRPVQA